jgi:hypothetical protein
MNYKKYSKLFLLCFLSAQGMPMAFAVCPDLNPGTILCKFANKDNPDNNTMYKSKKRSFYNGIVSQIFARPLGSTYSFPGCRPCYAQEEGCKNPLENALAFCAPYGGIETYYKKPFALQAQGFDLIKETLSNYGQTIGKMNVIKALLKTELGGNILKNFQTLVAENFGKNWSENVTLPNNEEKKFIHSLIPNTWQQIVIIVPIIHFILCNKYGQDYLYKIANYRPQKFLDFVQYIKRKIANQIENLVQDTDTISYNDLMDPSIPQANYRQNNQEQILPNQVQPIHLEEMHNFIDLTKTQDNLVNKEPNEPNEPNQFNEVINDRGYAIPNKVKNIPKEMKDVLNFVENPPQDEE